MAYYNSGLIVIDSDFKSSQKYHTKLVKNKRDIIKDEKRIHKEEITTSM